MHRLIQQAVEQQSTRTGRAPIEAKRELVRRQVHRPITLFVVPPIGAVPEGRTIVLWRYSIRADGQMQGLKLNFVDTADAACTRILGYVKLLCRGMMLATVASNSTILLRLPYSSLLHSIAEPTEK